MFNRLDKRNFDGGWRDLPGAPLYGGEEKCHVGLCGCKPLRIVLWVDQSAVDGFGSDSSYGPGGWFERGRARCICREWQGGAHSWRSGVGACCAACGWSKH